MLKLVRSYLFSLGLDLFLAPRLFSSCGAMHRDTAKHELANILVFKIKII
jgi:hypothetical protein